MNDDELIRRFVGGRDREALETLIVRHEAGVYNLLCRYLGNENDAADKTQDVFVRVIGELPSLRDPAAFVPWLYRIALNEARQAWRRRARTEPREHPMMPPSSPDAEAIPLMRAELARLPDEYRVPILLRYYEGMDYRGIALTLQCPEGTVGRRLHVGLERLRRALAPALPALSIAAVEAMFARDARAAVPNPLAARLREVCRSVRPVPVRTTTALRASLSVAGFVVLLGVAGFLLSGRTREQGGEPSPVQTAVNPRVTSPAPSVAASLPLPTGEIGGSVVEGIVRDQARAVPLAGATVNLYPIPDLQALEKGDAGKEALFKSFRDRGDPESDLGFRASASTRSAPDGRYRFEGLPAGRYAVGAIAPGYCREFADSKHAANSARHLPDPEDHDGQEERSERRERECFDAGCGAFSLDGSGSVTRDLGLVAARRIVGTVRDDAGRPIAGATVRIEQHLVPYRVPFQARALPEGQTGTSVVDSGPRGGVRTGADGSYVLDHVFPTGKCSVVAEAEGCCRRLDSASLDGAAGDFLLDVTLSRNRAAGHGWSVVGDSPAERSKALEAWVAKLKKSGDTFLYATELKSHFFAVFDLGPDDLGVFVKDSDNLWIGQVQVSDEKGFSVHNLDPGMVPFATRVVESQGAWGFAHKLRRNYSGKVKIRFWEARNWALGGEPSEAETGIRNLSEVLIQR